MNHLPILQELFESDTVIFFLIGLAVAAIAGILMKKKRMILPIALSILVYVICEAVSNIHTNYLVEMILLFVGTIALGAFIGSIVALVVQKVRK